MNTRKNKIVITMEDKLKSEDDVSANDYNDDREKIEEDKEEVSSSEKEIDEDISNEEEKTKTVEQDIADENSVSEDIAEPSKDEIEKEEIQDDEESIEEKEETSEDESFLQDVRGSEPLEENIEEELEETENSDAKEDNEDELKEEDNKHQDEDKSEVEAEDKDNDTDTLEDNTDAESTEQNEEDNEEPNEDGESPQKYEIVPVEAKKEKHHDFKELLHGHKGIAIILALVLIWTVCGFAIMAINNGRKETSSVAEQKVLDEFETISAAIDSLYSFDANKISQYFYEVKEEWLTELDFTSNLASSEELQSATNLSQLTDIKKELLKTVLLNEFSKVTINPGSTDESTLVTIKAKTVNLDEVTKNIVSSLLTVSIENGNGEQSVDELVNSYVESFKNVTKTEYTTSDENMTVELAKKDGHWVIKDFRKFINTMIPTGNFYEEYMTDVNSGVIEGEDTQSEAKGQNADTKTVTDVIKAQK